MSIAGGVLVVAGGGAGVVAVAVSAVQLEAIVSLGSALVGAGGLVFGIWLKWRLDRVDKLQQESRTDVAKVSELVPEDLPEWSRQLMREVRAISKVVTGIDSRVTQIEDGMHNNGTSHE